MAGHSPRGKCVWVLLLGFWLGGATVVRAQNPATPTAFPPDTAVRFSLSDTTTVFIGDISIHGNRRTKPYIIQREYAIAKGSYLTRAELKQKMELTREQVMNTALFVEVAVYVAAEAGDMVFINVDVKERWYLFPLPYFKIVDRNFNEWWVEHNRSFDRVNYGAKLMYNNVSGRNDKLNVWLIGGYTQQLSFRYEQPFANNSLTSGFDVGVSYAKTREVDYSTLLNKQQLYTDPHFVHTTLRIDASYLYRPAIKTQHRLRFSFVHEKIGDTIVAMNNNYFGNGITELSYPEISYAVSFSNADYRAYPSSGWVVDASITKRGFSSNMNLTALSAKASFTIPAYHKAWWHFQATGALRLPFDQPFYNQALFGYGADAYMRGQEYYVIDGVAGIIARATLRQEVLSFTLKNPIRSQTHDRIPVRILFKIYGDAGYAYSRNAPSDAPQLSSMLSNRALSTYGFGLDIVTIYDVVLRLEYSFNQLGGNGLFVHSRSDF